MTTVKKSLARKPSNPDQITHVAIRCRRRLAARFLQCSMALGSVQGLYAKSSVDLHNAEHTL